MHVPGQEVDSRKYFTLPTVFPSLILLSYLSLSSSLSLRLSQSLRLCLFFSLNVLGIWNVCGEGRPISDNLLVHFAHLFPIMCNITSVIR